MNPQAASTVSCDSAMFISDLHLSDQTPRLIAQFERFCAAVHSQWLIVMGDLFEGYCGDDDHSACIAAVDKAFLALHQRGVRVALMHGNRDFIIGQGFAQRCHVTVLDDPCVLLVTGSEQRILLSHGDRWCTLDVGYQSFRATSRVPSWQAAFLSQPLATRQAQIQAYRAQSKAAQMDVNNANTDVVDAAVLEEALRLNCATVLHGHTHRPSERLLSATKHAVRKLVLGDWDEGAYQNAYQGAYQDAGEIAGEIAGELGGEGAQGFASKPIVYAQLDAAGLHLMRG
jgi:UDP-2,3-diacylglucosamine hydrolase